jgi:threonine/homoserine efflux transporter RhtA
MSAEDDALARRRYGLIQGTRLAGIAALLVGLAVLTKTLVWPQALGAVLVVAGAFGTFLAPVLLARRWSSRRRP